MKNETKLAAYLRSSGISQQSLAEGVDVAPSSISKYCNGSMTPSVEIAKKIAKFLETDIAVIF